MRLTCIRIRGLFGRSDEVIDLDPDYPTVLTGGNGTGKSTILRIVHAISTGEVMKLSNAPFKEMVLEFQDDSNVSLTGSLGKIPSRLTWANHSFQLTRSNIPPNIPDWAIVELEQNNYDISETLESLLDVAAGAGIPYQEYRAVRDQLSPNAVDSMGIDRPDWMKKLASQFPTLFVSDQRLVTEAQKNSARGASVRHDSTQTTRLAVEVASSELAQKIREADSAYARSSQDADRRLPNQIINAMAQGNDPTEAQLNDLVALASDRRDDLRRVGLLDIDNYEPDLRPEFMSDVNVRRVMQELLRSTMTKLTVLDDLESRLNRFKQFLDQRFDRKQVQLSRRDGIRFGLPSGQSIRPRQLSSGEQQMMVLAYEILFKSREDTLIIIDEPELSLHMLWQDTLIDDLQRMGSASGVHFLMATHSPMILAGHSDLERPLGKVH